MQKETNLLINIVAIKKELEGFEKYFERDRRKKEEIQAAIEECEYIQVGLATIIEPNDEVNFDLQMSKDEFINYSEEIYNCLKEDIEAVKIDLLK